MLRLKRFWIGLVISLACLGFFLAHTNPSEIEHSFSDANLLLACAVTPLYFVGFWLRTIRWRYLLKPVADVPTSRLFPVVLIGLMANNIAPASVGELVRAYLVGERESMSKSTALGTIAVDRAFDGLTLVAILGVVIATSGNSAGLKSIGIGAALIFAVATLILVALAFSPTRARGLLLKLIRRLPEKLAAAFERLLDSFLSGLVAMRSPGALLGATAFSFASWGVEGAMYYLIGQAFHLDVGFDVYLLILAGSNLALSILQTPGGVGPFEATTQQILIAFGVTRGLASAYAIALHVLLLAPVVVVGFVLLWLTQFSLSDIMGVSKTPARPAPATPATPSTPVRSLE